MPRNQQALFAEWLAVRNGRVRDLTLDTNLRKTDQNS
jgi:hypothetical protein